MLLSVPTERGSLQIDFQISENLGKVGVVCVRRRHCKMIPAYFFSYVFFSATNRVVWHLAGTWMLQFRIMWT